MPEFSLEIGGFTPMTTIDYPGNLAAVVFLQGCPWRCRYCQNLHLIPRRAEKAREWDEIREFLHKRRGLLDGVVFSGGEPTMHKGLLGAAEEVKGLGFKVGLHTAGIYPQYLAKLLPYLDWVGIDIKTSEEGYRDLTAGGSTSGRQAWQSLGLVMERGIDCEVRTAVQPDLMGREELLTLAHDLAGRGVRDFVVQKCVTGRCLDETLTIPLRPAFLDEELKKELGNLFGNSLIRG